MTTEEIIEHRRKVDAHWNEILMKFLETGMRVMIYGGSQYHRYGVVIRKDGKSCSFQIGDHYRGFRCMINGRNCAGGYGYISDWDKPFMPEDIGDELYQKMLWEDLSDGRIQMCHFKEIVAYEGKIKVLEG